MWTKTQIKQHTKVAKLLYKIKDAAFKYIHQGVSEYEVQQFILKQFKRYGLKTDRDKPIVAFKQNTGLVHYFPKKKSKRLQKNSMILIDIWARLKQGGPYADITWMAYYGKPTKKEQEIFNIVIKARNKALSHLKKQVTKGKIPTGYTINKIAKDVIDSYGYLKNFDHFTGHSLGNYSPHGNRAGLRPSNKKKLLNMGYTIEPGIYLKNKFGARSEINVYLQKRKVILTTPMQKKLVKI
tara:strand:- start:1244 stop:1960 length:717 start_codon:yes stop_codon:yes gene_type:complete